MKSGVFFPCRYLSEHFFAASKAVVELSGISFWGYGSRRIERKMFSFQHYTICSLLAGVHIKIASREDVKANF